MSRPAATTDTQETSIGTVNECQTGIWLSLVDPDLSIETAAICEPFAGNSHTPTRDGHIAVISQGAIPAASAIGTRVRVVAD